MSDPQASTDAAESSAAETGAESAAESAAEDVLPAPTVRERLSSMWSVADLEDRIARGTLWYGRGQHMRRVRSLDEPAPREQGNFVFGDNPAIPRNRRDSVNRILAC